MSTITQTFESLCDKEFEMGRVDAYENLDREIAALKHQFSAKGALFSSNLAQAVVDVILKRFDVVLTAFENAYLNKWGATDRDLTETDMEWLKAKVSSKLDFEILQARTRAQNAFGATPAFAQFAGQAEVKARERHMRVFQKLDILKLRKEQAGMKKEAKEISPATAAKAMDANFIWEELHPAVVRIAKSRVESGNFADAVEACLKEVNDRIKKFVREKTAKEFDGADLMNRAFSLQNPIILLDDTTTTTGRDIQVGYMQIFAGAMTGIRNPKAHANIVIDRNRAIHLLFLASLLFFKLDERTH